ncbi:MAG: hypothetical protein ACFHX7_17145 [Pseudomonadota bacterium]
MKFELGPADRLTLLKLHRTWPERHLYANAPQQPVLFHRWLKTYHAENAAVKKLGDVADLSELLEEYRHVLSPSRTSTAPSNMRREPRIYNRAGVMLKVLRCDEDESLVGRSSRGSTLDVCMNGLRISTDKDFPEHGEFELIVTPSGFPITIYNLVGVPRWSTNEKGERTLGLQLKEVKDFERWQQEFGDRFGSK